MSLIFAATRICRTRKEVTMTKDEWLAACLAGAPPLSEAQLAILRTVFRPVLPPHPADEPAPKEPREPC